MVSLPRRKILALGGLAGLSAMTEGVPVRAAVPERASRIFMVTGRSEGPVEAGFKDYLARRGIKAEYTIRTTDGDPAKIRDAVAEIRAVRPDLVYTWGTPQTRGVVGPYDAPDPENYIRDIPVLFTFVAAPLDAHIVRSLDRPDGNVTGTVHIAPMPVQLNTILAYRGITRIGTVYNPAERNAILTIDDLRAEVSRRGLELVEAAIPLIDGKPDAAALPGLITEVKQRGAELLYIGPDTFVAFANRKVTAATALALGLPTFSATEPIIRAEPIMLAVASSSYGIGRFTGFKAAQILMDGKKPGDIPVETLRRFSVIINIAVAKQLTCYPPIGLLNFAEVVGA